MDVVAGVIEQDGCVLICQRKGGRHALKWEFPGGKVEPGEEPREALARELREELSIEARIGDLMARYDVTYGDGPAICLMLYRVTGFTGTPVNQAFERIVWERPKNLLSYDFLEGDLEFIRKLAIQE